MIRLNQAVIVEGKYDKITLENLIDATILVTDGFGIFKDTEKRRLIKTLAETCGIIILTDSDQAGQQIRRFIKNICADGQVQNVYIPQLKGRERRKSAPSKEGFLGVEGMTVSVLEEAFRKSGILQEKVPGNRPKITKNDLYFMGLSGCENSAAARAELSAYLHLPQGLSPSVFLDLVNTFYSAKEFEEKVESWHRDTDKK